MPAVIDLLRRDHCKIEELLQLLEQERAVVDRADRPDFDILGGLTSLRSIGMLTTKAC